MASNTYYLLQAQLHVREDSQEKTYKGCKKNKISIACIDALVQVSLEGIDSSIVGWNKVYEIWKNAKRRKILNI